MNRSFKRKGISGAAVLTIAALALFGLVIGITEGSAGSSLDFTKAQGINLQAERIANAMIVMETVPEGHIALEMTGYQLRYDQNDRNLSLNYSGEIGSKVIEEGMVNYNTVEGPETFKPVNGTLCIQKEQRDAGSALILNRSGCPDRDV